jgi:hypothetical protein
VSSSTTFELAGGIMPKDATKNVDRYKIRGGQLNEFDFNRNQEQFAEQQTKKATKETLFPKTTNVSTATNVTNATKAIKAAKATKSSKPAKGATVKLAARKTGKKAAQKTSKKPAGKISKKAARKTSKK